ncbi:MAG: hypothetical protein HFACDABA_01986 [Anaerolineales bacterium]|nr:hypothetical protein [Anaerolineales bacterium]
MGASDMIVRGAFYLGSVILHETAGKNATKPCPLLNAKQAFSKEDPFMFRLVSHYAGTSSQPGFAACFDTCPK